MAEFGSNAKANAALTTGIIGTAGVGMSLLNGGLGNLFGGWGCNNGAGNALVNRYEIGLLQDLAAKDSRIGLLESNIYTDTKIADVYERLNTKIGCLEREQADQRVYNATNTMAISCVQGQIAELMALTRRVVPNGSICPGFGDVTVSVTPATATTTGA